MDDRRRCCERFYQAVPYIDIQRINYGDDRVALDKGPGCYYRELGFFKIYILQIA